MVSVALLVASWVWFGCGVFRDLQIFYSTGPGAAGRWERIVAAVGAALAAGGIATAALARRRGDVGTGRIKVALLLNTVTFALFVAWLVL